MEVQVERAFKRYYISSFVGKETTLKQTESAWNFLQSIIQDS